MSPEKSQAFIRQQVLESLSAVLNTATSEIGWTKPFSTLGLDSIIGVELINRLNQALGIVLKTIIVFDYPTVNTLSSYIYESFGSRIQYPAEEPVAPPVMAGIRQPEPQLQQEIPVAAPVVVNHDLDSFFNEADTFNLDIESVQPLTLEDNFPVAPPVSKEAAVVADDNDATAKADDTHPYKGVWLKRPGSITGIEIVNLHPAAPGDDEVQILVKAFPVNFSDFLLLRGLYPVMPDYPFVPGAEMAGIVLQTGKNVKRLKRGDEVMGLTTVKMGGQGAVVNTDETFVVKKPSNITFEEAAGIPVAFVSMYMALERAQVKPGDKVLIHGAAGTNGLMAVQLAQQAGAEVYATVSTAEKARFLQDVGVAHIINYATGNFADRILSLTGGYGVDVVINTISVETIQPSLNILAPEGRYVELAVFGLQASGPLHLGHLISNQVFISLNVKKFFLQHPDKRLAYLDTMATYLRSGKVRPFMHRIFPFSAVKEAYQVKQDRNTIGRIVVSMPSVAVSSPAGEAPDKSPLQREIAVIGMAGRFPGAADVHAFWNNLVDGVDTVHETPADRWNNHQFYDPDPAKLDKTYCRWGAFLDDIDKFDAMFFNIAASEAALMDPHQRLFLEEAYHALEDAGYSRATLAGKRCGVYAGCGASDYLLKMSKQGVTKQAQSFWGNEASVIASRISYFLDLKGPAIAVNTACSSSLVAIHTACQSLRLGECEMALAGGIFISTDPDYYIVASNGNMFSPDGRSKTFDNSANGFGPGEAVGVLLLKPLDAARRDGDPVYAVIRGSAVNQDGRTNGITAPSSLAQTAVELEVYQQYGIDPATISYVEAHGTGTRLGDPVEVEALTNAFRKYTDRQQFCGIGSVKTNIGHTASAAGVSGVIKLLMALKHQQLPPSLHFHQANDYIDFVSSPFYVVDKLHPWPKQPDGPRRSAISSFGFSGTNSHLVLEEAPDDLYQPAVSLPACLVPLSAETAVALKRKQEDLLRWLQYQEVDADIAAVAYTLQTGREHFTHRTAFVARSAGELLQQLQGRVSSSNMVTSAAAINGMTENIRHQLSSPASYINSLLLLRDAYVNGYTPDWTALYDGVLPRRISLPGYPFERERYWLPDATPALHPLLTDDLSDHETETVLRGDEYFLTDHLFHGNKILPAAVMIEMARAAGQRLSGRPQAEILACSLLKPVIVTAPVTLSTKIMSQSDGSQHFDISSGEGGAIALYVTGVLMPSPLTVTIRDIRQLAAVCPHKADIEQCYRLFSLKGLQYGPAFRCLQSLQTGDGQAFAKLALQQGIQPGSYPVHPALLDGALQLVIAMETDATDTLLPYHFNKITFTGATAGHEIYAHLWQEPDHKNTRQLKQYNIDVLNSAGELVVSMHTFSIKNIRSVADNDGALLDRAAALLEEWDGDALQLSQLETLINNIYE
ncbi:MAG TPA: beta-ketoacyl synthase N-terminal-like domain-containing protein [Chitinophaga sp.]|uniref:beta-ketoacyl synthase N-terminal-like domain-containing protein n=1 Tax=Chitinophaga sp. TaxID=1869181 RepID=UPI002C9BE1AF|nr:beta-ketoacyl synthase N-terminal-like domain-containing protein [Chitinophaga sp.]HVI45849.1 beta-ketoacyl synthase N-terminal-like domain-containing protein [Chitinophaga sp.]